MTTTTDFIIRTEDIRPEEILGLFVSVKRDRELVDKLKGTIPVIVEGSRGTGKSLLLRVCEQEQLREFEQSRVFPVYVSFVRSSLLNSADQSQFQHWMLARLCARITRALSQSGYDVSSSSASKLLIGDDQKLGASKTKLEKLAEEFEETYKNPGFMIGIEGLPSVEAFKEAVEDICRDFNIRRLNILFDEAAHIFRPEQQRQFFTLFRDLRSPYMTCNAAVYPGVTSYGDSFEESHDAQIESLQRDINDSDYLQHMRDIVFKQADSKLQTEIVRAGNNFAALAYAVSGNPRLLLKTISLAGSLRTNDVERVLKEFFRTTIWSEHSGLAERYPGHKELIDWGRTFVEGIVAQDTNRKNEDWRKEGKTERTCFIWVHRDAPQAAKEGLRLLMYTGIVARLDSGVVATRREIGTRYAINIGCLAADTSSPITYINDLRKGLSIKRFTEYGANHSAFADISQKVGKLVEFDVSAILQKLLEQSVEVLDLSNHQEGALKSIGIDTVGKALKSTEADFMKAAYIGPKRSRKIMNTTTAAVL